MATIYEVVQETMTLMQTRMAAAKEPELHEKLRQKYMQAATLHVELRKADALWDIHNDLRLMNVNLEAIYQRASDLKLR